jgi:hypothetical protein
MIRKGAEEEEKLEKVGMLSRLWWCQGTSQRLMASRLFSRASPLPPTYRSEVECVRDVRRMVGQCAQRGREKEKEAENHERCTR